MVTDQLPNRVHPTGSETKYHVFNNQITDNVDIYHSEATTLKPKACTMKYTKTYGHILLLLIINLKTQRLYTNIYHTAHTNHTASNVINTFLWLHKVIKIAQRHPLCTYIIIQYRRSYEQYPTSRPFMLSPIIMIA